MNYDENEMLEYISYISHRTRDRDPTFDGYVLIDPDKIQAAKKLTLAQQDKALESLYQAGWLEGRQIDGNFYVKMLRNYGGGSTYQPRSEEECRWIVLAHHVPTYQHGKTVHDYVEKANRKREPS